MMNRRAFLLMAATALVASPAHADYVESVRAQLQKQGYQQISVSSTLLGRSRIVAVTGAGTREIIMNPRTGEILRDLWISALGTTGPSIVGNAEDDGDDGDDDDHDDDSGEDDDDHDDGDSDGDGDSDNSGPGGGGDDDSDRDDDRGEDGGDDND